MQLNNKRYFENEIPGKNQIEKSELIIEHLSRKKMFDKGKKNIKYRSLILTLILIVIFLFLYILILKKKLNKSEFLRNVYKIFRANIDIKLFLQNKTKFYYVYRNKHLNNRYNESNLKTFQQKMNYLIIHESPEYKSKIADKIKLNEYSKKIIGKDICIPIIKIYNDVEEINLDELPDKFVLKCNHGSGMNIFCKDKTTFNLERAKKILNNWLNINYGLRKAEFQYFFIERKVFASPYMGDNLIDYKTFCFNGKPKFIAARIILNQKRDKFIYNYYDLNWKLTKIEYGSSKYKRDPNIIIEKPKNLDLIINYASKLSKPFIFVRVDFYEINGTLFLGELTFTPSNIGNSFKNEKQRLYLGSLLDINKIKSFLYNN